MMFHLLAKNFLVEALSPLLNYGEKDKLLFKWNVLISSELKIKQTQGKKASEMERERKALSSSHQYFQNVRRFRPKYFLNWNCVSYNAVVIFNKQPISHANCEFKIFMTISSWKIKKIFNLHQYDWEIHFGTTRIHIFMQGTF